MLSWKSTFLLNRRITCGPCAIKNYFLPWQIKRALRIPIIVYRRNVRLMDILDKSTGLSKMPLSIGHDENIEQYDISHEYYEIRRGVCIFMKFKPRYFIVLIIYTKIRILNRCQNIKHHKHIKHACDWSNYLNVLTFYFHSKTGIQYYYQTGKRREYHICSVYTSIL